MKTGIGKIAAAFMLVTVLSLLLLPAEDVSAAAYSTAGVKANATGWVSSAGAYKYINKYRKSRKKRALRRHAKLEKAAKIRAREMAVSGKFSHTRPNGRSGLTLIKGNRYKGENIARGYTTCAKVSKAWYKSKGHRRNMLKKQYRYVGIACYKYRGVTYWVQLFSS